MARRAKTIAQPVASAEKACGHRQEIEVIDADGHISETDEQLKEFLDAPYRKRSRIYPIDQWDRGLAGTLGAVAGDAKAWITAMDSGGLSTAYLYPSAALSVGWIREPDVAVAVTRAYNDFVSEKFRKVNERLKPVALVPLQDVPEAVKEARRAIKELRLAGIMLPAVGLRKPLGHEDFWPVYAEAEKLDCMLGVHATVRGAHYFAGDLFDQFIEVHTVSHAFAQMMQMTSIIFRGVLERFPKLRIAFMGRLQLGAVLDGADGRGMEKARESRGTALQEQAKRVPAQRPDIPACRRL
jgi:predicted TIM-barrel fold metal-dependent hydrolase